MLLRSCFPVRRLRTAALSSLALLVGVDTPDGITLLYVLPAASVSKKTTDKIDALVPAGARVCGVATSVADHTHIKALSELFRGQAVVNVVVTEDAFACECFLNGSPTKPATFAEDHIDFDTCEELVTVKLTLGHTLSAIANISEASLKAQLDQRLASLLDPSVLWYCQQTGWVTSTKDTSIAGGALVGLGKTQAKKGKKNKQQNINEESPKLSNRNVVVYPLARTSPLTPTPHQSPLLTLKSTQSQQVHHAQFETYCIGVCHIHSPLGPVLQSMAQKSANQLRELCSMWAHNPASQPEVFVFCMPHFPLPITSPYPVDETKEPKDVLMEDREAYLKDRRSELHVMFGLELNRPLFRLANALSHNEDANPLVSRLVDVHHGLKESGLKGAAYYSIEGSYEYYHYMQDQFDDKGWGCAYRSLQTIISWFRLQRYTSLPVLSIPDIQSLLVKHGTKKPSFVGSNDWIGATDLSDLLNEYLGVQCKIHHLGTGAELANQGRVLAHHFETQGTPIMMGGGKFAYTLLGIDWNSSSGDIRFLILDPHFTGEDDLKLIQKKGWCGWKTIDLFDKTSFYNLCLPQRPSYY